MLSLLDRYIARHIIFGTALVMLVLVGLLAVTQVFDGIKYLGHADYNIVTLTALVLLKLPVRIYEFFPVAALIGGTAGLSLLGLNSELTAMRAGGISIARIGLSVLKVSLVFVVIGLLLGEGLAPVSGAFAERVRAKALGQSIHGNRDVWLRDGQSFVHIGEVLPNNQLAQVSVFRFSESGELLERMSARSATTTKSGWTLKAVRRTGFSSRGVRHSSQETIKWSTSINRELLQVFAAAPELMSSWQLGRYIGHLRKNHQQTARYELTLWSKLMVPISTAVMLLVGLPFVFGSGRSGGLGRRIFIAILLGLAYSFLQGGAGYYGFIGHLGLVYGAPVILSAILPTALFLMLAIGLMRRVA